MKMDLAGLRCLSPTDARVRIPAYTLLDTHSGHDNIMFTYVSATSFRSFWQGNLAAPCVLLLSGWILTWAAQASPTGTHAIPTSGPSDSSAVLVFPIALGRP